jgi:hypothetical protein
MVIGGLLQRRPESLVFGFGKTPLSSSVSEAYDAAPRYRARLPSASSRPKDVVCRRDKRRQQPKFQEFAHITGEVLEQFRHVTAAR